MIMRFFSIILSYTILIGVAYPAYSQQYRYPVTIPPALSGNFGELRSNHFHSGVDFKTQQVVNKPIVSIEDGYVSRISVAPGGYGLALYIDHPSTGHTSVYAHLNSFSDKIADWVTRQQYELERFAVNLYPDEGVLPVKKGEQVALSGNTGSPGPTPFRDPRQEHSRPAGSIGIHGSDTDTRRPDLRG